eukprot:3746166-Prymnesium_polylepis.1
MATHGAFTVELRLADETIGTLLVGNSTCPDDRTPLDWGDCGCRAGATPASGGARPGAGLPPCELCPAHTFQSLPGQDDCLPCAPGHNQPTPGSTSCLPCRNGTVVDHVTK